MRITAIAQLLLGLVGEDVQHALPPRNYVWSSPDGLWNGAV